MPKCVIWNLFIYIYIKHSHYVLLQCITIKKVHSETRGAPHSQLSICQLHYIHTCLCIHTRRYYLHNNSEIKVRSGFKLILLDIYIIRSTCSWPGHIFSYVAVTCTLTINSLYYTYIFL